MLEKIKLVGIIPVVKLERPEDAIPLAQALIDGGINCAEITFRTAAAPESIKLISEKFPDMLLGAGTVLNIQQLDAAIAAGAGFVVSPGFNPTVVRAAENRGVLMVPGCSSATDIEGALELGLKAVKFFPAEQNGGIAAIKALTGPYADILFMPTGGINTGNINDYLAFPKVLACGGSWMVDPALIAAGNFEEVTRRSRAAIDNILGYELVHVGVNSKDMEDAKKTADTFASLFNLPVKEGNSSVFAGTMLETMPTTPNRGAHGHIAIGTNSIPRAMYQLEQKGVKFLEDSIKTDDKGKIKAIYLDLELNGFGVHLFQK